MENKLNSGVEELLKSVPPPAPAPEPDNVPSEFVFNTTKDKAGVPLESPLYIKKGCKLCSGKGYQTFLVGDGYKTEGDQRIPRRSRSLRACFCVHQGYAKTRLALDRAVEAAMRLGVKPEDALAQVLKALGL